MSAIPCDNNRFIVISNTNMTDDLTPFVRMSISDNKEARIMSPIDHGQDEIREFMSQVECFGLAYSSKKIITGNHATLINNKTGLYWIFSLETASLKKAGNIFRNLKPEQIAKGGFFDAILCAHPEKDGTILISAQQEEAFATASDILVEYRDLAQRHNVGAPNATMSVAELLGIYNRRRQELAEQQPWIEWYRIYPETGKVEKLSLPPEGAAIDRDGGKNDLWRPMLDGSVKMGPLTLDQSHSDKNKSAEPKEPEQAVTSQVK